MFNNDRLTQRLFNRPSSSKTIFKKTTPKSFFSRPLSKWFSFSIISKHVIIGAIKVLSSESIPMAVFFGIIILGILSINGSVSFTIFLAMLLITFIHILVKVLKIQPFLTDSNPSSAIILKTIVLRIKTTLLHRTPNLIKSCPTHIMFHRLSIANYKLSVKQLCTL